jgi:hypothetical protein
MPGVVANSHGLVGACLPLRQAQGPEPGEGQAIQRGSHLSGKSCAKCARFRNPKSEVQNPKQVKIRMRKYLNAQKACILFRLF